MGTEHTFEETLKLDVKSEESVVCEYTVSGFCFCVLLFMFMDMFQSLHK